MTDGPLVATDAALAAVIARAARAPRVAVDAESNGLFVYAPALCVLQLAWQEDDETRVAVIDPFAVSIAPLAPLMSAEGPVKVLHDLTLDAQLLAAAGAPLARVRDTSVAARLLGRKATGLASLLDSELGIHHDKRLQNHDWARRPLGDEEIAYLAGDVRHLLDLDTHLALAAEAVDIAEEIAEECDYKLATAITPRREAKPGWMRTKGADALDDAGLAALRALWNAREIAAARERVPPFKITSAEALLEMAKKRPASIDALAKIRAAVAGLAGRYVEAWLTAIEERGEVTAEERATLSPPAPSRQAIAKERTARARVMGFRRAEAARRGVDEQAVLPGHCADDVVAALVAEGDEIAFRAAIAAIPGLGAKRLARYEDAFVALSQP